jgi:RNA polymerase sigma-70 factor, ECF subfamily
MEFFSGRFDLHRGENVSSPVTTRFPTLVTCKRTRRTTKSPDGPRLDEVQASDEALMSRIQQGDQESLAGLFRRYSRTVRGVALRILRDPSEAEDLVQEVFLFIHRKCNIFDPSKCSARSWIVQVTYHRAIDRRRYLQSRHFYTHVDLNGEEDICDPNRETEEINTFGSESTAKATIEGLLESLSEDQRNTLTLHFYEGYAFDEIALKLGQSWGNIRNHYYRGLDKLRKQLFLARVRGSKGPWRT